MVVRNELPQRPSDEQLELISLPVPEHAAPPPIANHSRYNDPVVHWYRNIFSHVPSTKVREIAAMLEAIHAGEDVVAARQKAVQVIEKLRGLRLTRAAELVAAAAEETLTYYAFPEEHWRRIPTTDEIDKRFFVNRATPQVHSFVRPRHRSFFRPGRRFLDPPRAGAVKAGRSWGDRKARP
jgi:hypothetical protein